MRRNRFLAVTLVPFVFFLWLAQAAGGVDTLRLLVLNTPQLAWAVPLFPPGPSLVRTIGPTPGDPAERGALYVPGSNGRYPGLVILSGISASGYRNPQVETLARSLAIMGVAVYVPNLPGLRRGQATLEAMDALGGDVDWLAGSRYVSRPRVTLLGVCAGASLAILVAEEKDEAPLVHAVIAIDPYAAMRDLVEAAATGSAPGTGGSLQPFTMTPWAVWALAHSTAYTIRDPAARITVLDAIGPASSEDPLALFRTTAPPAGLSPAAAAWWKLWADRSRSDFPGLYRALPGHVRDELAALSPVDRIGSVTVPVSVIVPTVDTAYPPGEALRLARGNTRMVHLTVTPLINHVTPDLSGADLSGFFSLWRFAGGMVATVRQEKSAAGGAVNYPLL